MHFSGAVIAHHLVPRQLSKLVVVDGFAWGWAVADTVYLYANGQHVATECTGIALPHAVLRACGRPPAGAGGFAFALPARLKDGLPHDIHVALPTLDGEQLHGPAQAYRSGPAGGTVQQRGSQFVGTVWFAAKPQAAGREAAVLLCVTTEQGQLAHSQALLVAATPDNQGYPAQFSVAASALPEALRQSALHFSVDGQELQGSPCLLAQTLLGVLDDVGKGRISGWALDATDLLQPLELVLRVDGQAVSWFRPNVRRPDICKYLELPESGMGLAGFNMPLPAVLADGARHFVEVVSAADGQSLQSGRQWVRLPPARVHWDVRGGANAKPRVTPPLRRPWVQPVVSVVLLNRNGHDVLAAFLQSWERHNTTLPTELIVVDHASADNSLALLEQWRERLDLKVVALDHNDSFSASCNLGASLARGPYVLFMNNDIVWLQDALPRMLESLQEPQVGVVGIKLLKVVAESRASGQFVSEVQHLGVRFMLRNVGYWPYEVEPSATHDEAEHAPQYVPAVTGAVLLCRKDDFDAVGGFDPAYFYGFEDVELCLRLAYRLQKAVVCRNDCVALHHHGHTRLSGREISIYDRVLRNSAVLESHIGIWIKQAYWRSLINGDGYMTRESLVIGIVLDAPLPAGSGAAQPTPLVRDALDLANQIGVILPKATVVLLPPDRDWKNGDGLHVLLVGDPRYDIRALHHVRSDVLTVAWLRGKPSGWAQLAWWDEFGGVLATERGQTVADALLQMLGPKRWRLRVRVQAPTEQLACARRLQKHLREQGLPCWVQVSGSKERFARMADVCISVGASACATAADTLQLVWPGGTAPLPDAAWLALQMEKHVGSTFHSP